MRFIKTKLVGVFLIKLVQKEDGRGFFARNWDTKEFKKLGLEATIVQINMSYSRKKGTLRGLHYQAYPYGESKVIRCTKGAIYDVVVDVRPKSPTYKKWIGVKLTDKNRTMIYIPKYCAHAFLTLENNTEVSYFVSQFYTPKFERGIRYDDPAFKIKWVRAPKIIIERDKNWPDFKSE